VPAAEAIVRAAFEAMTFDDFGIEELGEFVAPESVGYWIGYGAKVLWNIFCC
jgi:hypothetical protein